MLSAIGLDYDDGSGMDFGVDQAGISMKRFECAICAPWLYDVCDILPKTDGQTYRFCLY
jgi:hypothetical protein